MCNGCIEHMILKKIMYVNNNSLTIIKNDRIEGKACEEEEEGKEDWKRTGGKRKERKGRGRESKTSPNSKEAWANGWRTHRPWNTTHYNGEREQRVVGEERKKRGGEGRGMEE